MSVVFVGAPPSVISFTDLKSYSLRSGWLMRAMAIVGIICSRVTRSRWMSSRTVTGSNFLTITWVPPSRLHAAQRDEVLNGAVAVTQVFDLGDEFRVEEKDARGCVIQDVAQLLRAEANVQGK